MRILIVDDDASIRKTTGMAVELMGHKVELAPGGARALKMLEEEPCDVCFLDVNLGSENGLDLLDKILKLQPGIVAVMFTAYANISTAVDAMRRGAFDFIPKPFTPDQIRQVLGKIERERKLEQRVRALESQITSESVDIGFDSAEPAMQRAVQIVFKAAETPATILLLGPSGTGKSVLAREIHRRGQQRDGAFVTVNCPSLSRELLESELFGHVKGSFTGAVGDTMGKVAAAEGGTLFLDEIGELPLGIQPKLLRLLQEREYERVGEAKVRRANVSVIAATNRDLEAEVREGKFREDLFYRLNVINVTLPPLRERPGDLMQLASGALQHFAAAMGKHTSRFAPEVREAFVRYGWPGNLRELRNVIERAVILASGPEIVMADLPEQFSSRPGSGIQVGARVTLDELENEHIRRIIAASKNLEEAARTLGIDPATLYRKRQKMAGAHVAQATPQ
jgi:NtrC-family two-component system response regulator AlgB